MTSEWRVAIELGARSGAIQAEAAARALRQIEANASAALTSAQVAAWAGVTAEVVRDLLVIARGARQTMPTVGFTEEGTSAPSRTGQGALSTPSVVQGKGSPPAADPPTMRVSQWRVQEAALANRTDWKIGDTVLGLYDVISVLGEGGMGKVYRVRHRQWNVDLAVKCPRPEVFFRAEGKDDFIREAETWIDLGVHPHIATCYYVRTVEEVPRIFAELVEGGSLQRWIRERKLGDPAAILDVAIQSAWGLEASHRKGIVHQDVKPANILMMKDGTAKVTDFGLARARAAVEGASKVAHAGPLVSVAGMTPAYASPEQARSQRLTLHTDMWSWGVTVLEMFVGEVTWVTGVVAPMLLKALLEKKPETLQGPPMPKGLAELLERCFRSEPSQRWGDMGEVAERLHEVYRKETGHPFPRPKPHEVQGRGDTLNNRAVSLLDLGQVERAEVLLADALRACPGHLEATYNSSLLHWRTGKKTDEAVLQALATQASPEAAVCRGLLHLERGDSEEAVRELGAATAALPDRGDVWTSFGLAHLSIGKASEAKHALDRAARLGWALGDVASMSVARMSERRTGLTRVLPPCAHDITALAFAKDGRTVAAGTSRGSVLLWDSSKEGPVRTCRLKDRPLLAVSFDAQGERVFAGGEEGTVDVLDVASGKPLASVQGRSMRIRCVALDRSSESALLCDRDGKLTLLNLKEAGARAHGWRGAHVAGQAIALSPGAALAVSAGGNQLRLWDLALESEIASAAGPEADATCLAISSDGRDLLSGATDGSLRVWDLKTLKCRRALVGHRGGVKAVAFLGGNKRAVTAGADGTLRVWNLATGSCLRTLGSGEGEIGALAASADGGSVASGGRDRTLRLWHVAGGGIREAPFVLCRPRPAAEEARDDQSFQDLLRQADAAQKAGNPAEAYRLIRSALALPGFERSMEARERLRLLAPRAHRRTPSGAWERTDSLGGQALITAVAMTKDAKTAMVAEGARIQVWDLHGGGSRKSVDLQARRATRITGSHNAKWIYAAVDDEAIHRAEVATGKATPISSGRPLGKVLSLVLLPDQRTLAVATAEPAFLLLDAARGTVLRRFHVESAITDICPSPDGKLLASAGLDGSVNIWDTGASFPIRTFRTAGGAASRVIFSPVGGYVAAGYRDGSVRLGDLRSGQEIAEFAGTKSPVLDLALTPDGVFLLVAHEDGTITTWSVAERRVIHSFRLHARAISAAVFAKDGSLMLAANKSRGLSLLELDWDLEFPCGDRDERDAEAARAHDAPWKGPKSFKWQLLRLGGWLRRYGRTVSIAAVLCVASLAFGVYEWTRVPSVASLQEQMVDDPRRAVSGLLDVLHRGDPFERKNAISIILSTKDVTLDHRAILRDALPLLRAALNDEVPEVRLMTMDLLGRMGADAVDAVPDLCRAVISPEKQTSSSASRALVTVCQASERAREQVTREPNVQVRLAIIRSAYGANDIPTLAEFLSDPDSSVRSEATQRLSNFDYCFFNQGHGLPAAAWGLLSQANRQGKILLLDFYGAWCPWCLKMDVTLADAEVKSRLRGQFSYYKLDIGRFERFQGCMATFKVTGVPCLIAFSADGAVLDRQDGYVDVARFTVFLTRVAEMNAPKR